MVVIRCFSILLSVIGVFLMGFEVSHPPVHDFGSGDGEYYWDVAEEYETFHPWLLVPFVISLLWSITTAVLWFLQDGRTLPALLRLNIDLVLCLTFLVTGAFAGVAGVTWVGFQPWDVDCLPSKGCDAMKAYAKAVYRNALLILTSLGFAGLQAFFNFVMWVHACAILHNSVVAERESASSESPTPSSGPKPSPKDHQHLPLLSSGGGANYSTLTSNSSIQSTSVS